MVEHRKDGRRLSSTKDGFSIQEGRPRSTKQLKTSIKRPQNQKRTLEALGLKKIGQVVEHEATPNILGMIDKVKHLVEINSVNK